MAGNSNEPWSAGEKIVAAVLLTIVGLFVLLGIALLFLGSGPRHTDWASRPYVPIGETVYFVWGG